MQHVRLLGFTPVEGIFMQINNKTFEKFITMNLNSKICSYLGFSLLSHVFTRFLSSFLQDWKAGMKYFLVVDIYFFIYNLLRGETFILCRAEKKCFSIKYVVYEKINIHNNKIFHVQNEIFLFHIIK